MRRALAIIATLATGLSIGTIAVSLLGERAPADEPSASSPLIPPSSLPSQQLPAPSAPGSSDDATPTASTQPVDDDYHLVAIPLPATVATDVESLLAVAGDGSAWADRDSAIDAGPLHLTRNGQGTIDVTLTQGAAFGPQAAEFSPDGTMLVVADGAGSLWRVDVSTGAASLISTGADQLVFGLGMAFQSADRLLVNMVGSVQVPIPSRIARVTLNGETSTVDVLTPDDYSAYYPLPLSDGRVAYVHENEGGSKAIWTVSIAGTTQKLAEVGETLWVDLNPTGTVIAYERDSMTYTYDVASGVATMLLPGNRPRFSPDGTALAVVDPLSLQTLVVSMSGVQLNSVDSLSTAWVRCTGDCQQ
jgi:hypothetical protein